MLTTLRTSKRALPPLIVSTPVSNNVNTSIHSRSYNNTTDTNNNNNNSSTNQNNNNMVSNSLSNSNNNTNYNYDINTSSFASADTTSGASIIPPMHSGRPQVPISHRPILTANSTNSSSQPTLPKPKARPFQSSFISQSEPPTPVPSSKPPSAPLIDRLTAQLLRPHNRNPVPSSVDSVTMPRYMVRSTQPSS